MHNKVLILEEAIANSGYHCPLDLSRTHPAKLKRQTAMIWWYAKNKHWCMVITRHYKFHINKKPAQKKPRNA